MICKNCGKEIEQDSIFCKFCGTNNMDEKADELDYDNDLLEDIEKNNDIKQSQSSDAMEQIQDLDNAVEQDTEQEENILNSKSKIAFIKNHITVVALIIFIVIIGIILGIQAITSNLNYSKGIEALLNDNYKEAIGYFEKSKKSNAEEKIKFANELIKSDKRYEEGMKSYKDKDYKSAYESLSLLNTLHPKYDKSQKIIAEIKPILAQDYLAKAKDSYSKNYYSEACDFIQKSLQYDSNQKEAKELSEIYNDKNNEIVNKIAEEAAAKAEEAAKIERQKYAPQKIVDTGGKQIWKIYVSDSSLHFTGTYKGNGNFIVKLSDSNQELVEVIANEIGDYMADKTVSVPYEGWYYLEVYGSDGKWTFNWN